MTLDRFEALTGAAVTLDTDNGFIRFEHPGRMAKMAYGAENQVKEVFLDQVIGVSLQPPTFAGRGTFQVTVRGTAAVKPGPPDPYSVFFDKNQHDGFVWLEGQLREILQQRPPEPTPAPGAAAQTSGPIFTGMSHEGGRKLLRSVSARLGSMAGEVGAGTATASPAARARC